MMILHRTLIRCFRIRVGPKSTQSCMTLLFLQFFTLEYYKMSIHPYRTGLSKDDLKLYDDASIFTTFYYYLSKYIILRSSLYISIHLRNDESCWLWNTFLLLTESYIATNSYCLSLRNERKTLKNSHANSIWRNVLIEPCTYVTIQTCILS